MRARDYAVWYKHDKVTNRIEYEDEDQHQHQHKNMAYPL